MSFIKDENGQGMLEYVLIIAIVAVIAIVALVVIKNVAKDK
jgi:Flp pilus assembly pilin Flp